MAIESQVQAHPIVEIVLRLLSKHANLWQLDGRAEPALAQVLDLLEGGDDRVIVVGEPSWQTAHVDRCAHPSIAIDSHVEIETPKPVCQRADKPIERILFVERRNERRKPCADFCTIRWNTAALAPADELARASHDRHVMLRVRRVIVIEADEIDDRAHARRVERCR